MRAIKEKKPKHHYLVYIVGEGAGVYAKDYCKHLVGETWAVSEKQACNNVRYQNRDRNSPNGGYSSWDIGDYCDEGYVNFSYKAELAE